MTQKEYEAQNAKGFEGDSFLETEIRNLVKEYKIDQIIETGTYHGFTTKKLAQMASTLTCEINHSFFRIAQKNLEKTKNVSMFYGNSVDALKQILPTFKAENKNLFFFLDAHWQKYCPLLDELKEIANAGLKPVIAIHDFKVPDRPDLGFDEYQGQAFEYSWIEKAVKEIYGDKFKYHYNDKAEGAKRGVIFIYPCS